MRTLPLPVALSICCVTARPSRAAAVLSTVRQIADEIVVAVDLSGGEQDLTPLNAVADSVFQIELDAFPEPAMTWLHAQCQADWILRIDDDEVPSAGLLAQLPELIRERDVLQYWLARRWLYPDPGHWLEQWPWFPDFQGRLVRNDAQLWFPGLSHTSVAPAFPARYLDVGLYHLVHLLSDRRERELRVERYLTVARARREVAADGLLSRYYLPEHHPDAPRAQVDPRDNGLIYAALKRPPVASHAGAAASARSVDRAEFQARWAARDFDAAAYSATIRAIDVHRQLVVDEHRPFRVCVRNEGSEWWPGGEDRQPLIRVAYRWLTWEGEVFEGEGIRTALPHPLAPGERCLVAMNVAAPAIAGRYLLAPDLVHEHVRWFACQSPSVEMLVTAPEAHSR